MCNNRTQLTVHGILAVPDSRICPSLQILGTCQGTSISTKVVWHKAQSLCLSPSPSPKLVSSPTPLVKTHEQIRDGAAPDPRRHEGLHPSTHSTRLPSPTSPVPTIHRHRRHRGLHPGCTRSPRLFTAAVWRASPILSGPTAVPHAPRTRDPCAVWDPPAWWAASVRDDACATRSHGHEYLCAAAASAAAGPDRGANWGQLSGGASVFNSIFTFLYARRSRFPVSY